MSDDNSTLGKAEEAGNEATASNDLLANSGEAKEVHASQKASSVDAKKDSSESFSADYVKKIREEAKEHRTKAKDLENKLAEAQKELDTLGRNTLDKTMKLNAAIEKRLINSELQKLASENGLIDIDLLKMIDLKGVELSSDGEVVGLEQTFEKFKVNKPHLFKAVSTANPNAKAPTGFIPSDTERPVYKNDAETQAAQDKYLASL